MKIQLCDDCRRAAHTPVNSHGRLAGKAQRVMGMILCATCADRRRRQQAQRSSADT